MTRLYSSVLETIGNTPVVRLEKMAPPGVELYAKLESFNPGGSVKDRMALSVIEDAERSGALRPGQTVVEATSGNTGISLAMVCARKGYPLVITMAENFSVERRKLMRFLGAQVILTPAAEKGTGMLAKAVELAEKHGWFLCRQFENEANADVHSRTTAQEILRDFDGKKLDYWVTGFGTGGTLKGTARVLREKRPDLKIIACEPDNSPIIASGVPQPKGPDGKMSESHPHFRPHLMQGWAPDFISKLTEDAVAAKLIDRIMPINGAKALQMSRELALKEGILTGVTGGATLMGALDLCREVPSGTTVLCMIPDTGERYLSTPLFEDIAVDMTDAEIKISRSTPRYRFDVSNAPAPAAAQAEAPPAFSDKAAAFVEQVLSAKQQPVVLFALEWCEYTWSVRKMFKKLDVPFLSIDLDSAEYQKDNWGGDVRAALRAKTGMKTIPQIFIGGELIGGCTETLDAYNEGRLEKLLAQCGVKIDASLVDNAYTFLPGWIHPR